jgi:hypothetical protein
MSKPSQSRLNYSKRIGRACEALFVLTAESLGFEVVKSSVSDDMTKHIDFYLFFDGQGGWGVDVKGKNKHDEIWCEFKNVKGNKGWMLGEADIIAFDMPTSNGFCIVDRQELLSFCLDFVSGEIVDNKHDAYGKIYTRKGRKDEITKIKMSDLEQLKSFRVWVYPSEK